LENGGGANHNTRLILRKKHENICNREETGGKHRKENGAYLPWAARRIIKQSAGACFVFPSEKINRIRRERKWKSGRSTQRGNWRYDSGAADFSKADLRKANFREADLRGTDLRDADLWGANLRAANKKELFVQAQLNLPQPKRTFRQNAAVWALVTAIFESMEGRKPSTEEKYELYLDLLELYADKVLNRFTDSPRPVHISASNTVEGAKLIEGLLFHLSTECCMDSGIAADVIAILQKFEIWKGGLALDPCDYRDGARTVMLSESEWQTRFNSPRPYCFTRIGRA
jgi:hypothetical protein